jgi:NitT/TauT family transport system permease protein
MIKRILQQLIFYMLLIVIWQGLFYFGTAVFGWWRPYAFPNPVGVWNSLLAMIRQNILFAAVFFSMRRALFGFLISILIGASIGMILSRMQRLAAMIKPLILGVQSLPSVCWVPFAILWFGLTENSILFVVVMGSAFCISIAVESAIRNVNPLYIKAAATMGARGLHGGHLWQPRSCPQPSASDKL